VRIGVQATPRGRDLHAFKPFDGAAASGAAPYVQMPDQRLGDLLANREDGIKRGGRLLEDHRDAIAAQFLEPLSEAAVTSSPSSTTRPPIAQL